jgi:hypothetical protein
VILTLGRFLIAQLHMTLLLDQVTFKDLTEAIDELPEELDDVYDTIMERIDSQDPPRKRQLRKKRGIAARMALKWLTYARETLTLEKLQHAIAISLDPDLSELDADDLIDVDVLLATCLGLVVLNKENEVIRLVHYTTQRYLKKNFAKVDANATLARASMTYLSLPGQVPHGGGGLLGYAGRHWAEHVREGGEEALASDVIRFLESPKTCQLLPSLVMLHHHPVTPSAMLHFLSLYGLSVVFRKYLMEADKVAGKPYNTGWKFP